LQRCAGGADIEARTADAVVGPQRWHSASGLMMAVQHLRQLSVSVDVSTFLAQSLGAWLAYAGWSAWHACQDVNPMHITDRFSNKQV
jgi:hypothetical protein